MKRVLETLFLVLFTENSLDSYQIISSFSDDILSMENYIHCVFFIYISTFYIHMFKCLEVFLLILVPINTKLDHKHSFNLLNLEEQLQLYRLLQI